MSTYSSYDADALYAGASIGIVLLSYGIAFLITIILQIVVAIPFYKMAKNAGYRHAWVSFVPFGNFYYATVLPQKEFNLFNKFIWPDRAKAFWVYIISIIIYIVLAFPISFFAAIPIIGWILGGLLLVVYVLAFCALWYAIMWRVYYDLLMEYGMEQHAMWASIVTLFCPIVIVVFSYIIMNREPISNGNSYYYQ